jgi:phage shock protein E
MSFLKRLFGPGLDFKAMLNDGAIVIDVRSPGEFASGHVKGSKNIPLQQLASGVKSLKKDQKIITVCASGMRSGSAKSQLKSMGFQFVENGGPWGRIQGLK